MVDGLIILLGTAVEIKDKKQREVSLRLKGSGSNFLDEFLSAFDQIEYVINYELLQQSNNAEAYNRFLDNISLYLKWVNRSNDLRIWKIKRQTYNQLLDWLMTERERHLQEEESSVNKQLLNSSQERIVKFQFPPNR
jgi:hypothetical protein